MFVRVCNIFAHIRSEKLFTLIVDMGYIQAMQSICNSIRIDKVGVMLSLQDWYWFNCSCVGDYATDGVDYRNGENVRVILFYQPCRHRHIYKKGMISMSILYYV